jgi:hypothetical protein
MWSAARVVVAQQLVDSSAVDQGHFNPDLDRSVIDILV